MKSAFALLLLSTAAMGQQPCAGGAPPKNAPDCIPAERWVQQYAPIVPGVQQVQAGAKALACEKYQHFVADECHGVDGMWACPTDPNAGHCAPDMHAVSEKDWQELMARLKKLEDPCKSTLDGPVACLSRK